MAHTTDDLVAAVRRSGWLPSASDVTASDLLAWGDECVSEDFVELLKTGRDEVGIVYEDVSLVANQTRYRLPRRATLRTVRGITFVDADGSEWPADEVPALSTWRYQGSQFNAAGAFYRFEGDELVLNVAPPTSAGALRIRYFRRLSRMVSVSEGARIREATSTTEIAVVDAPEWVVGISDDDAWVDVVRGDSPFPTFYPDRLATAFADEVVTLDATTPIAVADIATDAITHERRDYLCRRDETVYPPLPGEMHGALSWGIVSRVLEAEGDSRFTLAQARYTRALERLRNSAEPRNQDRKPRIIDYGSRLRGGKRWGMWR